MALNGRPESITQAPVVALLAEIRQLYALPAGQEVRCVRPPFPAAPGRAFPVNLPLTGTGCARPVRGGTASPSCRRA